MEKQKTILAIDDNPQQLQTYDLYLSQQYNVLLADSVDKALEILIKQSKPDVILLDIDMPDIDGYEFISNIKLNLVNMDNPIIVISGNDDPELRKKLEKSDAFDVLTKPVNKDILLKVIEKALGRK